MNERRYTPLGTVRLILSVLVVLGHSLAVLGGGDAIVLLSPQNCGVALFFMVSGYVMFNAFFAYYRDAPGRFITNRFIRLFPPLLVTYALAVVLAMAAGEGLPSVKVLALNAASLGPYFNTTWPGSTSHFWSILVEFKWYFAMAALFVIMGNSKVERRWILAYLAACAVAFIAVEITNSEKRFFGALQWAPYFCFGSVYYAYVSGRLKRLEGLAGLAGLLGLCVIHYLPYSQSPSPWQATAFFLAMTALFMTACQWNPGQGIARIDRLMGDLTYPIYLCHYPILHALKESGMLEGNTAVAMIVVTVTTAALALHWGVERPVTAFRDRIRGAKLVV